MKFLDESGLNYLWGKIQNYSDEAASSAVNDLFTGNTSKIDAAYLPSYVDDVVEFDGYEDHTGEVGFNAQAGSVPNNTPFKIVYDKGSKQFYGKVESSSTIYYYTWPDTEGKAKYREDFNNNGKGDKGKIYVDASTNKQYRWAGQDAGLVELSTASAIYYPKNENLSTVNKLGDINAGTSASTLAGKTISEVLDDILFVTEVPTITAASGSATFTDASNLVYVGSDVFNTDNLAITVTQAHTNGSYSENQNTHAIEKDDNANITLTQNTSGSPTKTVKYSANGSSSWSDFSGSKYNNAGVYKYTITKDIESNGNTYLNNKGVTVTPTYSPNPSYVSATYNVTATYPLYSNGTKDTADSSGKPSTYKNGVTSGTISNSDAIAELAKTNVVTGSKQIIIAFKQETDDDKAKFEFPSAASLKKVEWYNSNALEPWTNFTAYTVTTGTGTTGENSNGIAEGRKQWKTSGSGNGPTTYRFTFN